MTNLETDDFNIVILRLGHRPSRDKRITTHVCLTARTFGAKGVLLASNDPYLKDNIDSISRRFGGAFFIKNNVNPIVEINEWKKNGGKICHLSMYGINYPLISSEIQCEKNILIIVGAEKVPPEYYKISDWNVAIGNQPHSEVAALSVFLDRYYTSLGKDPLQKKFTNSLIQINPCRNGKQVNINKYNND